MRAIRRAGVSRGRATAGIIGSLAIIAAAGLLMAPGARAQSTTPNSLKLLWIAPGDDGDQGQVSSYELRYSTSPVGSDTTLWWNGIPSAQRLTLGPPLAPAGADDSTNVTGLTQNTTYYFVLRALDEYSNRSDFSNVASATTASCNAPTVPPGGFGAAADTGEVSVTWNATSDPLAQSLHLYRATGPSGGSFSLIQTLPPSSTSYLDTSVAAGTTYRYRAAYMGSLCEGPSTTVATATVPGPPPPPPTTSNTATPKIHVYPNPSSGPIRIVMNVAAAAPVPVYIRLFDMNGRWIATPVNGSYPPGTTEVPWNRVGRDGRNVEPGYYELIGTVGITKVRERIVLVP